MAKYKGGEFLYFPTVLAPITVSYNLAGVDDLQLTPATIAKIFQREITDLERPGDRRRQPRRRPARHRHHRRPPLRRLGHHRELHQVPRTPPSAQDGGGTWKLGIGLRPSSGRPTPRPATATRASPRSSSATEGAIGYVDLSDAKATGLTYASVKNKAGKFVEPTLEARPRPPTSAEIADDLTFFARLGRRRRRVPDHRPDVDHRLHEPDRRGQGRGPQGVPRATS